MVFRLAISYVKNFALSGGVSLFFFFCHANAKLASEHWTIIVIENIANSRFLSSTLDSRMCLLS